MDHGHFPVQLRSDGMQACWPVVRVRHAKPWGHSCWPGPQYRAQTLWPMPAPASGNVTGRATQVPPAHSVEEPQGWQCGKARVATPQVFITPSQSSQVRQALVPGQMRDTCSPVMPRFT